jgi:hypothetical protein
MLMSNGVKVASGQSPKCSKSRKTVIKAGLLRETAARILAHLVDGTGSPSRRMARWSSFTSALPW